MDNKYSIIGVVLSIDLKFHFSDTPNKEINKMLLCITGVKFQIGVKNNTSNT